jgi:hypothetical protein
VLLGRAAHSRRPPPGPLDGTAGDSGRADGGGAGGVQPRDEQAAQPLPEQG